MAGATRRKPPPKPSLVAQGNTILVLDERGILLLIKANPKEFELMEERQISDQDTWVPVAMAGEEIFGCKLNAISAFRWRTPKMQSEISTNPGQK